MADSRWKNFVKKLNPYMIKKGILYLKHFGFKEFMVRLSDRIEPEEVPYGPWYEKHRASDEELERQRKHPLPRQPLISIAVPIYKTPERFLREMIESVQAQTYSRWELCLADGSPEDESMNRVLREYVKKDSRIRVRRMKENLGIVENTNAALAMAKGEFVGFLDHDDLLAPDALYELAKCLQKENPPEFLYTDEDKITGDGGEHFQPNLKPDFNPDLLRSNNYICHFVLASAGLIGRVGGLRKEYEGAQDYDFILRCTEQAEGIAHVPRILYHWRTHAASTADNPLSKQYAYEAGKRAIEDHLKRCGLKGEVSLKKDFGFYRVKYPVLGSPLVSIVIPNKDEKDTLKTCLDSIFDRSSYRNFEIIIVENNSKSEEIFQYYEEIDGRNGIRVVYWDKGFNYSAINNFGIRHARGEYLLLLNNDMEVISRDWIQELLSHCQRPGTGIVGARLYYPDDTIQHAGIIVGIGGVGGSLFVGMKRSHTGYLHKESLQQNLSAVTAACMMAKRSAFEQVGGLSEELEVAFNDIDFCLKLREAGYLIVYNPYAELYHYESKSRGLEDTPEKVARFNREIKTFEERWPDILRDGDPFYNPNLTLDSQDFSLKRI